ncbi:MULTISPECIES: DUF4280 domain-containing protein [Prevotella]|jgi:hypothetical protein|uniref:DUF4280 domain-containing protein n=1 Tax=Prevotella histicola TaxID=470565 RepID=UPI001C5DC860|nr:MULTISPECIES: DUF4280 domain-containing protein [Prevotella]MBF1583787.1 DUF4280 domain-containing protein [Prevotella sp.]MBF1600351.1 DUF4280 domain-containing protein [Prevotella sp.]MBW4775252.1 DUF4280 domain-containing protein [Prevotella histicola]
MSKIVTDGALMSCTLGDIDSALIVDSQSFVSISSKFIGTETDNQGLKNIPSFGLCKCGSPNPPCIPQPQGWQHTTQKDSINGMKKLTEQSFCMCAKGGRISFVNTGSNSFVESE